MTELKTALTVDEVMSEYRKGITERILYLVDGSLYPYVLLIEDVTGSNHSGMVSHEQDYGSLDYFIDSQMFDQSFGYFVIDEAEMDYSYDSYTGEGDAEMYAGYPRPARMYEIREVESFTVTCKAFPRQLYLHFLYLWKGW